MVKKCFDCALCPAIRLTVTSRHHGHLTPAGMPAGRTDRYGSIIMTVICYCSPQVVILQSHTKPGLESGFSRWLIGFPTITATYLLKAIQLYFQRFLNLDSLLYHISKFLSRARIVEQKSHVKNVFLCLLPLRILTLSNRDKGIAFHDAPIATPRESRNVTPFSVSSRGARFTHPLSEVNLLHRLAEGKLQPSVALRVGNRRRMHRAR